MPRHHARKRVLPSALRGFLRSEAAGGWVLIVAAVLAVLVANGPFSDSYQRLLQSDVGPLSLIHWINDGLMALFFLLVGLEIKRELIDGHLAQPSARALPVIAAAGGMIVPALVYLAVAGGDPALVRGWAIPAATDIAFAVGILALLGKRIPPSLKLLLITIAIVDDMGAVVIIALFYSSGIDGAALALAAGLLAAMTALNRAGHRRLVTYLVLAAALWTATLLSGVHATIAGVLAAFAIPLRPAPGIIRAEQPRAFSPLIRLEHALQPLVAYAIVPLFALANAGVALAGIGLAQALSPLPLGIVLGLLIGKQVGIYASIRLAVALGFDERPAGATWLQVYGLALLCGIGFTMSLFIGGLAFTDPLLDAEMRLGVLAGSTLSGLAGFLLLRFAPVRRASA